MGIEHLEELFWCVEASFMVACVVAAIASWSCPLISRARHYFGSLGRDNGWLWVAGRLKISTWSDSRLLLFQTLITADSWSMHPPSTFDSGRPSGEPSFPYWLWTQGEILFGLLPLSDGTTTETMLSDREKSNCSDSLGVSLHKVDIWLMSDKHCDSPW